jgi:hypothetical protein
MIHEWIWNSDGMILTPFDYDHECTSHNAWRIEHLEVTDFYKAHFTGV